MAISSFVLQSVLQAALCHGVMSSLLGRRASFADCLRTGVRFVLPAALIGLVTGIACFFGLLCLVVPGVILALGWAVSVPVAVVEERGVFESIGRSWSLTDGYKGQIFLLALIYGVVVWIGSMAVGSATKYDANHNALGNVAVRWPAKKAAAVELGGAGTDPDGRGTTYALGVDDAGMVVGVGQSFGPAHNETGWRALRWLPGHDTAQVLKPLSQWIDGSTYTYAYGVNRKGWIAGAANVKMNKSGAYNDFNNVQIHAVVWGPDGSVHDLNKLIPQDGKWTLYNAYGISDTGLVTGIGWYQEAPDLAPYQRLYALQLDKTGDGL